MHYHRHEMGRKWICFNQSSIKDFEKIHYKVMKVCVEWNEKERDILDKENSTLRLRNPALE